MMLKDMHVRENLHTVDNHQTTTTKFTTRRGWMLSLTTLLLLGVLFICALLAVSFITYNFTACEPFSILKKKDINNCSISTQSPTIESNINGGVLDGKDRANLDVRLPRSVIPLTYNISIIPYLFNGNFTFSGETYIVVQTKNIDEDIYNITMHATQLRISKSDVTVRRIPSNFMPNIDDDSNDYLKISQQYFIEVKQFFVIEFSDKLEHNAKYEIHIRFAGDLLDYLQGFYRSSYMVGNQTRWIASTQFQATDARRAFPCFDEPALKSRFTLNIARPTNMTTVSNMPKISNASRPVENIPNYVWDQYEESLPMSTYLVAFAVTDFAHLTNDNFTVWARPEVIQSAKYALSVGPKILQYLENFFNIPFPLPKMDMMALPDFQAGAMENWGLITFRETAMLFEEGISPTTSKQRIASVISHELAHQWFGNLVTPSWWSDIWLNEGFATYMEYLGVDAVETEWKTMDQFVVNEVQNVFQLDALSSSHKISVEVGNPDEISEIFDRISYSKGATIIRMMSHFLTSTVFRSGLTNYLKDKAYSAATQDDLWKFLTIEANANGILKNVATVKEIMDTWTLQTGFPYIKVSRISNSTIIKLEQKKFAYINGDEAINQNKEEPLWWIPITYTTSNDLNFNETRTKIWIPRSKTIEIDNQNLSNANWFIFNIQLTGYYRTNYDLDNWEAITQYLIDVKNSKSIAPANRAQLIDDILNFARAGYLSYDIAMNFTRYLIHEEEHLPWKAAIRAFIFIDSMFVRQGDYDLLKEYLLNLLAFVYSKVGFNTDIRDPADMLTILKRSEILGLACHLGHSNCVSECSRHFQNWIQVPNPDANNPIPPHLRNIVYCTAIQYGTEVEWNFAFERYLHGRDSSEKALLLTALGCSKEPWILARYLRRTLNDVNIRKQDMSSVFGAVASNAIGQQITFDFVRENWEAIKEYLGTASSLYSIIEHSARGMNSKFQLAELKTFVREELKEDSRSLQQTIEKVQVNVNWMNRNYKMIIEWLKREAISRNSQNVYRTKDYSPHKA